MKINLLLKRIKNKLIDLEFKVIEINIAGKTKEILKEQLQKVDIIFVAGGNAFYLLKKALDSGFDKNCQKTC